MKRDSSSFSREEDAKRRRIYDNYDNNNRNRPPPNGSSSFNNNNQQQFRDYPLNNGNSGGGSGGARGNNSGGPDFRYSSNNNNNNRDQQMNQQQQRNSMPPPPSSSSSQYRGYNNPPPSSSNNNNNNRYYSSQTQQQHSNDSYYRSGGQHMQPQQHHNNMPPPPSRYQQQPQGMNDPRYFDRERERAHYNSQQQQQSLSRDNYGSQMMRNRDEFGYRMGGQPPPSSNYNNSHQQMNHSHQQQQHYNSNYPPYQHQSQYPPQSQHYQYQNQQQQQSHYSQQQSNQMNNYGRQNPNHNNSSMQMNSPLKKQSGMNNNNTGNNNQNPNKQNAKGGQKREKTNKPNPLPKLNVKNDYAQHFVDTGERPQNFIRDPDLEDRFDEFPKLKELVTMKDELINSRANQPMYLQCDLKTFDLSSLGTKFDVILIDPPWEEYSRRMPGENIPFWSFDEIANLRIGDIAESPSFLWLWCGDEEGLEQGRLLLKHWGFRRCEDIVWLKSNKQQQKQSTANTMGPTRGADSKSIFHHTKEHCLMGIKGTVRRNQDGHIIHANVDTDVIIAEDNEAFMKPIELYHMIEHFALGRRRIELFGLDHNIRRGWVTLGKDVNGSNYKVDKYETFFFPEGKDDHLLGTTAKIEELRPKSPTAIHGKGGEQK